MTDAERRGEQSVGGQVTGAYAIGAFSTGRGLLPSQCGGSCFGVMAIGSLVIKRMSIDTLKIKRLEVGTLRARKLEIIKD